MSPIEKLLEESRRELLDLSTRNRLLSIPIESKSAKLIHIRDEKSDAIYRLLVLEHKAMGFLPGIEKKSPPTGSEGGTDEAGEFDDEESGLPQPDEEIDEATGEARRHVDTKLQTALSSDGLQKRLLGLYRDAQLIMEEQGVNILYLALGRLKWFEAEKADTPRYAPLILIPVQLERRSVRERFLLKWREEEAQENLSLAAKLQSEFGIELPKFPSDEDLLPSRYAEAVANAVIGRDGWEVDLDAMTLGFFSFAKFLMYRDLDARNWPDPKRLVEHAALGSLLRDGFATDELPFPQDVHLDELIPAARLDHVVDADGSQTIAIEMVRQGRSLVIQGPPGTGKSQSITNIIATAVLDGKKVLFVAEKLAALEVVKRRLEAAGVGALCLELHSHKSNKRAVLEEIGRTWQLGQPRGQELESVVARLENMRSRLNAHVAMLHTRLEPASITPFRILGELATLGERGRELGEVDFLDTVAWSTDGYRERRALVGELAQRVEIMGAPSTHPWRGTECATVLNIDLPRIREKIDRLVGARASLREETRRLARLLRQQEPTDLANVERLYEIAEQVATAPPLDRNAVSDDVWDKHTVALKGLLGDGSAFDEARRKLVMVLEDPIVREITGNELQASKEKITRVALALPSLNATAQTLASLIRQPLPLDFAHMEALRRMVSHAAAAPRLDRNALCHTVWNAGLDGLRDLVAHGRAFSELRSKLSSRVIEAAAETDLTAARAAIAAHGRSIFRFLSSEFRRGMASFRGILREAVPPTHTERIALLDDLLAMHRHLLKLREYSENGRQAFGVIWRAEDSDWQQLTAIIDWVANENDACVDSDFRKVFCEIKPSEDITTLNSLFREQLGEAWLSTGSLKEAFALDFNSIFGCSTQEGIKLSDLSARVAQWSQKVAYLLDAHQQLLSQSPLFAWEQLASLASWVSREASIDDNVTFGNISCGTVQSEALTRPVAAILPPARARFHSVCAASDPGTRAFGTYWRVENSDWDALKEIFNWIQHGAKAGLGKEFRELFSNLDADTDFAILAAKLRQQVDITQLAATALIGEVVLNLRAAFGCDSMENIPFCVLDERLIEWHARLEDITHWNTWFSRAMRAKQSGIGQIVEGLESGRLPCGAAVDVFDRGYYSRWLREAVKLTPELIQFNGLEHERLVADFRRADMDRLKLAKYRVLATHCHSLPARHAGLGGTGVLLGELERKRGHRPVRKLLKDAGNVVQAIKPVFMMSPLSVAQFLEPGSIQFDLLVIDEASQVQPVDALGAFARAKQHIVVGDSRQLPPTRFFARLTSNDDGDSDIDETDMPAAQAKDVESILGLCSARGLPDTMLRWHYRSRHHSLIAVSNREFYEDKLFIVPSPHLASSGLGLSFHFVEGGIYDRGQSGTNRVEARAVCRAILEHARRHHHLSLGVAAFSMRQRQAILDELELLRRENPDLEAFFHSHPHEPFFVKNLENVQGDERDVVFISVGYGPDSSGYVAMNFGPLSSEGGERRLNVLISRAKQRCDVFASLHADDIDLARVTGRGVRAFKTFLQFAETGRLAVAARSGREEDSPFEEAVRRSVESIGYEVHPQVGVAGFFVDLGVVDPAKPGRYILGIECDGAAYHSSRSARDRDRLRQAVLEDHGWIIHRIWSTDWFQRPGEQLRKVAAALEQAKIALAEAPPLFPLNTEPKNTEIEREPANIVEDVECLAVPYVEARFNVFSAAPHELSVKQMADVLFLIVQVEGPVHEDELTARVRDLWGLGRAGSRIQDSVTRGIRALLVSQRCQREEDCLFLPDAAVRVRNRENVQSGSLRKAESLPPQEIRAAIEAVAVAHFGASTRELTVAVSRLLGFKATSSVLREVIALQVKVLQGRGRLIEQDGLLRIATNELK